MPANPIAAAFADADILIGGTRPWDIRLKKGCEWRFYLRVGILNSYGFGKSYIDGTFECEDLYSMLYRILQRLQKRPRSILRKLFPTMPRSLPEWGIRGKLALARIFPWLDAQSESASGAAIRMHYDNGNAFYRLMLGPTETYSCGFFFGTENVDAAQLIKVLHTFSKLGIDPKAEDVHVLEIGCGWGWAAATLAKLYPNVTFHCFTISEEQFNRAKEAHKELIDAGRLKFYLKDYRRIPEHFKCRCLDGVYSIGMFEHVGPDHYDEFAQIATRFVKTGRRIVLHSISGNGGVDPFIWYYIFKGGFLPMQTQVDKAFEPYAKAKHRENLGPHYAKTLRAWRMNLLAAWDKLIGMGYSEEFLRMYVFYLASCEAAFKVGKIDLVQWTFVVPADRTANDNRIDDFDWNRPKYEVAA